MSAAVQGGKVVGVQQRVDRVRLVLWDKQDGYESVLDLCRACAGGAALAVRPGDVVWTEGVVAHWASEDLRVKDKEIPVLRLDWRGRRICCGTAAPIPGDSP